MSSSSTATSDIATESPSSNEPVVSVDWLHANLKNPDVKVLDASWYLPVEKRNPLQEYEVARIPGALFFNLDGISDRSTDLPHMLPREEAFAAAVSALGIHNKDLVVVYDGKGNFSSTRIWWMFRVFGHDRVWVLDGGLPQWRASGFEVESGATGDSILKASAAVDAVEKIYNGETVSLVTFQARYRPHLIWTLEQGWLEEEPLWLLRVIIRDNPHWVKRNIEDQSYQHIDARPKGRFDGVAPEPREGIRSGHIPGSRCIPFVEMSDGSGTLLPTDKLKAKFEQEGISLSSPVMASCGTGVTACILALGLHRLGKKDVPIYDGSWTEWALQPDTLLLTS